MNLSLKHPSRLTSNDLQRLYQADHQGSDRLVHSKEPLKNQLSDKKGLKHRTKVRPGVVTPFRLLAKTNDSVAIGDKSSTWERLSPESPDSPAKLPTAVPPGVTEKRV